MAKLLEIKDMSVRYRVSGGMLSAVNNVNLTINTAETFCLIGESGCGKSTLALVLLHRMILLFLPRFESYGLLSGYNTLCFLQIKTPSHYAYFKVQRRAFYDPSILYQYVPFHSARLNRA